MASYLGDYEGRYGKSAEGRIAKFHRAINSVRQQTFKDWELIIVADGCETTIAEAQGHAWDVGSTDRVRFLRIPKQRLWSEKVRNAGIHKALGQYVLYLDTDDKFGPDHLRMAHTGLQDNDLPLWGHMDDQVWDANLQQWLARKSRIEVPGGAGTSNLVHAGAQTIYWPTIDYRWPENGYDHDRQFIRHLMNNYGPPAYLGHGEYMVCHVPRQYDI